MSLFCPVEADEDICCDVGRTTASAAEVLRKKHLVPAGEDVVMVGGRPLVLRPVALRAEDIQEGHRYYHYLIGGRVYAGIFVGNGTHAS